MGDDKKKYLLKLFVDEEEYKKINKYKDAGNKIVEITLRQEKGQIESMQQALFDKGVTDDASNDILDALAKKMNGLATKEQVGKAVKAVKDAEGKIDGLSSNIKNVSMQFSKIFKTTQLLKTISFINTGLNVANLVVNIAGFIIIAKKLDALDAKITKELASLSEKVDIVIANTTNEHYREFHKLIMEYNSISDYLDESSLKDIDELLLETRSFFTLLVADYHQHIVDADICLEMITGLLPVYTSLLDVFVVKHYTAKQKMPNNYEQYMSIYDELLSSSFLKEMTDLLFMEKSLNWGVVSQAVDSFVCSIVSYATHIIDRTELIKIFENEARLKSFDKKLNEHVKEEALSYADEIADELGISSNECKHVMELALS